MKNDLNLKLMFQERARRQQEDLKATFDGRSYSIGLRLINEALALTAQVVFGYDQIRLQQ